MKIKSLLAIGAMIVPTMAFSANYFKNGTQWTVKVGGEPSSMKTIIYSLDDGPVTETEDPQALRLTKTIENGEQTLEAIILAEGEKVFFWNDQNGWQLLYDFSLQPGDETVIFSGMYNPDSQAYPESVVVKCNKIENSFGNVSFEDGVFFFSTYLPQTDAAYSQAIWYNGIGSYQGPLTNFENDLDGEIRRLTKVTSDGEVIFDYEKEAGVNTITDDTSVGAPTYRLDGIRDNGQGGIIISKGKKLIRRTK